MQYAQPRCGHYFIGDCMPFFHAGVFRLFYLLDEDHHRALNGVGGHQWLQASTTDLRAWVLEGGHKPLADSPGEDLPMALPLTAPDEGSMCTGSVFFHEGVYHAFYATRLRDRTEHISRAESTDGVHFTKTEPRLLASPPVGFRPSDYRDPTVFRDDSTGLFHLLASAWMTPSAAAQAGTAPGVGALVHYTSANLRDWRWQEPFYVPGLPGVPECPDYFAWNGWYYLLYGSEGVEHYVMSRAPLGPWTRPAVDTFDGGALRVMKTAAFGDSRRLGVGWLGTRAADEDGGRDQFGGAVVFREILQHPDGTLGAAFVDELTPGNGAPWTAATDQGDLALFDNPAQALPREQELAFGLHALAGEESVCLALGAAGAAPAGFALRLSITPRGGQGSLTLRLPRLRAGCAEMVLTLDAAAGRIHLGQRSIAHLSGLDGPFTLEIVCLGDIADVCFAGRRTIVERARWSKGAQTDAASIDSGLQLRLTARALDLTGHVENLRILGGVL